MRLTYIIVILVLTRFGHVYAQQSESLQGHWAVDMDETILRSSQTSDDRIGKLPARAKENLKSAFEGKEFIFADDNQLMMKFKKGNEQKTFNGSWQYIEASKELILNLGGNSKTFQVKWEAPNFILLDYGKNPTEGGVIKFLCLTRN